MSIGLRRNGINATWWSVGLIVLAVGWAGGITGAAQRRPTAPAAPLNAPSPSPADTPSRPDRSGWLGIFLRDAVDGGIEVVALVPRGPAEQGGLLPGDVLVAVDGRPLAQRDDLGPALGQRRSGEAVVFTLLRRGRVTEREIKLGARPEAPVVVMPRDQPPQLDARPGEGSRDVGLECASITPELRRHYGAPEAAGVLVTRVVPGRPASEAGVRVGDVLVRLNGTAVTRAERLAPAVDTLWASRQRLEFAVVRAGSTRTLTWSAPPRPDDAAAGADGVPPPVPGRVDEVARRQEIERLRQRLRELELEDLAAEQDGPD